MTSAKKNSGRRWLAELPVNHESVRGLPHRERNRFVTVLGFRARGYERAVEIAEELFGQDAVVVEFALPSGYKVSATARHRGVVYFTKDTTYGVKYLCACCRKETVGINWSGERMHWSFCTSYVPRTPVEDAAHG